MDLLGVQTGAPLGVTPLGRFGLTRDEPEAPAAAPKKRAKKSKA
jgi:hypothetical protein